VLLLGPGHEPDLLRAGTAARRRLRARPRGALRQPHDPHLSPECPRRRLPPGVGDRHHARAASPEAPPGPAALPRPPRGSGAARRTGRRPPPPARAPPPP